MNVLIISVYTRLLQRIPDPGPDVDPHFKLSAFKVYRNGYIYLGSDMKHQDACNLIPIQVRVIPGLRQWVYPGTPRYICFFST